MRQAGRSGYGNLITLDIGGTSTDVCVVTGGVPVSCTQEFQLDGLPIRTPVLDIVSVGAGGGSIVWVDDGGMLRVGPRSRRRRSRSGLLRQGRHGADAHRRACRARHDPARAPSSVDACSSTAAAAARAFEPIAQRFGLTLEAAADSAVALADANIVRAIQLISTERGHDPRDYVLVPFGGAGPAACRARRRGTRHRDHRRAARCRRDLGLRAGRLRFRPVRERDARDDRSTRAAAHDAARGLSPTCADGRCECADMQAAGRARLPLTRSRCVSSARPSRCRCRSRSRSSKLCAPEVVQVFVSMPDNLWENLRKQIDSQVYRFAYPPVAKGLGI